LAELPVRLIEAPEFRLAGAEEVIRQMVASIEQVLQHHEPLARELANRAADLHDRLRVLATSPPQPSGQTPVRTSVFRKSSPGGRKPPVTADLQEMLQSYPKTLFQGLMLRQAGDIFLTLRGHLADEMREVNFCRVRLGELLRMLEEPAQTEDTIRAKSAIVKHLFPGGCKDLKETVAYFEAQLTDQDLNVLDAKMEAMLKKQFTALVNVCLTSGNLLKNVETAMRRTAEEFMAVRLSEMNVAEMFLEQHPDGAQAAEQITGFFDEAVPQLPNSVLPPRKGGEAVELCVLSVPSGPAGERFRALASEAMPEANWQSATGDEDILLYRERANLPLSELPQLGPLAQDAYKQMSNAEHFTPHCRTDLDFGDSD
jgi:hypothetical protein